MRIAHTLHLRQLRRAVLLGVACCAGTRSLAAQSNFPPTSPRFQEVMRLAQETYADSARNMIARIIAGMSPSDGSYPEALYTSASIARSIEDQQRLFSRIAVEYSSSPWADKALYRLATLQYGMNQLDGVLISVKRIFADYPESPTIPSASLWGARAAFQKNELALGCDWLKKGVAKVGTDIELKGQLEFNKLRCVVGVGVELAPPITESLRVAPPTTGVTPPTGTRGTTTPPPPPPPPPTKVDTTPKPKPATTAAAGKWRVQVAAITSKTAITRTVSKVKALGYTAYQVNAGGNLVKVQAGPFATRDAALAAVPRLTKAIGGKLFVVQVP